MKPKDNNSEYLSSRGILQKILPNKKSASQDKHPGLAKKWSFWQRASDNLSARMGSWGFLLIFFVFLLLWISANVVAFIERWDPYPFILLNLFLSCLAAIQAPIILMSQNRQSQKDRIRMEYDYAVNRKSEREIEQIRSQLDRIEKRLSK